MPVELYSIDGLKCLTGQYRDFIQSSPLCNFTLLFKNDSRKLFINPWYMAEQSEYFYKLCLNREFAEGLSGEALIVDVTFEEMLEMLHSISRPHKPITAENCALLLRLSDRFLMVSLKESCKSFIMSDQIKQISLDANVLRILAEADRVFHSNELMLSKLFERCTQINRDELRSHGLEHLSAKLVFELMSRQMEVMNTKNNAEKQNDLSRLRSQLGYYLMDAYANYKVHVFQSNISGLAICANIHLNDRNRSKRECLACLKCDRWFCTAMCVTFFSQNSPVCQCLPLSLW